jgi:hypothetical protein
MRSGGFRSGGMSEDEKPRYIAAFELIARPVVSHVTADPDLEPCNILQGRLQLDCKAGYLRATPNLCWNSSFYMRRMGSFKVVRKFITQQLAYEQHAWPSVAIALIFRVRIPLRALTCICILRSRYSDWLQAGRLRDRVPIGYPPDRLWDPSASYPMDTGGSFPEGKAALAWSWLLISN